MARREKLPQIPEQGESPIGTKIRVIRWYVGLTRAELATAAGNYDPTHISHIEVGSANPSEELLTGIATVFKMSVDQLKNADRSQLTQWLASERLTQRKSPNRRAVRGATADKSHNLDALATGGVFGAPVSLGDEGERQSITPFAERVAQIMAESRLPFGERELAEQLIIEAALGICKVIQTQIRREGR